MTLSLTMGKRLALFACLTLLFYVITAVVTGLILHIGGADPKWMRICAVIQDLMLFILPALLTAMLCTRLPARFLCIDKAPDFRLAMLAMVTLLVAVPAMNALIQWNESITLPDAWQPVEQWMREHEETARHSMQAIMGMHSVMSLVVSIMIVGVLAGLSEELFFRGTFQRLLTTGGVSAHVAVWLVAIVFSAIHLQFYGFFARMLLGAYFGYLLVWTRSLWIPIIAHMFNNICYLVAAYLAPAADTAQPLDTANDGSNLAVTAVSIVLTAVLIAALHRLAGKTMVNKV